MTKIGIRLQFPEIVKISDVKIVGSSNSAKGIVNNQTRDRFRNIVKYDNITLTGRFTKGIENRIPDVIFSGLNINSYESGSLKDSAAVFNGVAGINSKYSGIIEGSYFENGFVNAAEYTTSDLQITGIFKNAIFTYFNESNTYSSRYKAYIRLLDDQSRYIDGGRRGDTYELYVYNATTKAYELKTPVLK